jgi:hypothetical protein
MLSVLTASPTELWMHLRHVLDCTYHVADGDWAADFSVGLSDVTHDVVLASS